MLLPMGVSAQDAETGGGLLGLGTLFGSDGQLFGKSGEGDPEIELEGIQNDDFGAPLGSGIAILLGAGLGYVALKKKEDKQ